MIWPLILSDDAAIMQTSSDTSCEISNDLIEIS